MDARENTEESAGGKAHMMMYLFVTNLAYEQAGARSKGQGVHITTASNVTKSNGFCLSKKFTCKPSSIVRQKSSPARTEQSSSPVCTTGTL